MTRRIFACAVYAGLAAGVAFALLSFAFVIPPLLEGELYEGGERVHFGAGGSPESEAGAPSLGGDIRRHGLTAALSVVSFTAFGLLMSAAFAIASRRGARIDARTGLAWGAAGFFAVQLAPAAGLPPELPGTVAAEIGARQIWWGMTVVLSLAGVALIGFGSGLAAVAGGVALLLIPHLVGAPHLDRYFGVAPPELAAHFATRSMAVSAAGWAVLGAVAGHFWSRADASERTPRAA